MSAAEKLPYVPPDELEIEKAAKLASQYPKIHACSGPQFWGRLLQFESLEDFRGRTSPCGEPQEDAFCTMEHRHCECGSTLMVLTAIHDLEAE